MVSKKIIPLLMLVMAGIFIFIGCDIDEEIEKRLDDSQTQIVDKTSEKIANKVSKDLPDKIADKTAKKIVGEKTKEVVDKAKEKAPKSNDDDPSPCKPNQARLSPPSWIQGEWKDEFNTFVFTSNNIVDTKTDFQKAFGSCIAETVSTESKYATTVIVSLPSSTTTTVYLFDKVSETEIDYSLTVNKKELGYIRLSRVGSTYSKPKPKLDFQPKTPPRDWGISVYGTRRNVRMVAASLFGIVDERVTEHRVTIKLEMHFTCVPNSYKFDFAVINFNKEVNLNYVFTDSLMSANYFYPNLKFDGESLPTEFWQSSELPKTLYVRDGYRQAFYEKALKSQTMFLGLRLHKLGEVYFEFSLKGIGSLDARIKQKCSNGTSRFEKSPFI